MKEKRSGPLCPTRKYPECNDDSAAGRTITISAGKCSLSRCRRLHLHNNSAAAVAATRTAVASVDGRQCIHRAENLIKIRHIYLLSETNNICAI